MLIVSGPCICGVSAAFLIHSGGKKGGQAPFAGKSMMQAAKEFLTATDRGQNLGRVVICDETALVNFLAINGDRRRSRDPKSHPIPLHRKDGDMDVATDDDVFTTTTAEYQHVFFPAKGVSGSIRPTRPETPTATEWPVETHLPPVHETWRKNKASAAQ